MPLRILRNNLARRLHQALSRSPSQTNEPSTGGSIDTRAAPSGTGGGAPKSIVTVASRGTSVPPGETETTRVAMVVEVGSGTAVGVGLGVGVAVGVGVGLGVGVAVGVGAGLVVGVAVGRGVCRGARGRRPGWSWARNERSGDRCRRGFVLGGTGGG